MTFKLFSLFSGHSEFYSFLKYFNPTLFFTLTIVLLMGFYVSKRFKKWYEERTKMFHLASKLPGPPTLPLLGNALLFACKPEETLERIRDVASKYKSPIRFWLGSKLLIFLYEPQDYEVILNSSEANRKDSLYQFMVPFLGQGLVTNSGPTHHSHRKAILPTLNNKALNEYMKYLENHCRIFTEILEEKVNSEEFDIQPLLGRLTFDVMFETILGIYGDFQKNGHGNLIYWIKTMHELTHTRMIKGWLHLDFIFWLSGLAKKQKEGHKVIHDFIKSVVARKKKEHDALKKGEITSDRPKLMLLEQLIDYIDKTDLMNDNEIKDEIFTTFIAAQDTVAVTSSFALLNLAIDQEIQNKVRDEIREVLGDENLEFDHLPKLKYTELVIKETLRLYPIAPMMVRETTGDIKLETVTLPKGCSLMLLPIMTHRSEKYWTDPEKFIPERFLPENSSKRHPYTYIPFSGGFRGCIGQKYAIMCLKTIIVHVIRKFKVESTQKLENLRLKSDIVIRSRDGYMISLTRL